METIMQIIAFMAAHGLELLGALTLILNGVIAICVLVPGEQPEKALQWIVDFIAKFSKK
jgi:hypothetical protein